jgi:hypothetical protein
VAWQYGSQHQRKASNINGGSSSAAARYNRQHDRTLPAARRGAREGEGGMAYLTSAVAKGGVAVRWHRAQLYPRHQRNLA